MGSTLDPKNFPGARRRRKTHNGHDTGALGPSDSSDTGSDMTGPGMLDDDLLNLERGTHQDSEAGKRNVANAGASVGDVALDDNSDHHGTGEHVTAGKDPQGLNADRDVDRVVDASEAGLGGGLDQGEEAQRGTTDEEIEHEARRKSEPRKRSKR